MDLRLGQGAVVVTVPPAQPLLDLAATELGWPAATVLPAHVTLVYPWFDPGELGPADLDALAGICAEVPAFDLVLDRFGTFPGVLWLAPDPAEPFVRLTTAIAARWPARPPYGGAYRRVTPHLSVLDLDAVGIGASDDERLVDAVARLGSLLPVAHRVTEVSYLVVGPDSATEVTMPLGGSRLSG